MATNASGKKRPASPAVDETKDLFDVEISDEVHQKLEAFNKEMYRAELINERAALKRLAPVYKKRRELLKTIPKFWPVTLMNHPAFAPHVQHADDQKALVALEDLWVERDENEPRAFTLEFHFGENPYFANKVLKKEYKYAPPPAAKDEKPDEDGITPSMLDFDFDRDVQEQTTRINWKSDAVNLTKISKRVRQDGDVSESGSFFHFFTQEDPWELGHLFVTEIFPEAIQIYEGRLDMELTDDEDEDEEDEEDDDDDAAEIDLEKPEPKKQRKH